MNNLTSIWLFKIFFLIKHEHSYTGYRGIRKSRMTKHRNLCKQLENKYFCLRVASMYAFIICGCCGMYYFNILNRCNKWRTGQNEIFIFIKEIK